jgi:hypothetical protein
MFATTEERNAQSGEGITRTSAPGAKFWPVLIKFGGGTPMKATIKATSKDEALQFARNRHPNASSIRVQPLKELRKWR